ncbi:MAG: hypothetical protein ACOY3K_03465 [Candidatus Omnitrophota bacterium]
MDRKRILQLIAVSFGLLFASSLLFAEEIVQIKVLAVNPSDKMPLETEITYPLPPEISQEDILDNAGMETRFERDKGAYVLVAQVNLAPSETKTFMVKVRNVWKVSQEQVDQLRGGLQGDLKHLENTKYFDSAKLLVDKALAQLDMIETENAQSLGIRQRIELFRAHTKQMEELRSGVLSMDALQRIEAQKGEDVPTVSFVVTAENPSERPMKMSVRAELPRDIKPADVIEKADFLVMFDEEKGRYFLEQQREFAPKEAKKFEVKLRDIWRIPEAELKYVRDQAEKVEIYFQGSQYEAFAQQNIGVIKTTLTEIDGLQKEVADKSIDQRMRAHVLNTQKLKIAQKKLKELQDIMLELPLKKKEDSIFQKLERGIKEIQKIADASKLLSMGIDPSVSTTWWIIFGIMIFLAFLAIIFYVTWLGKLSKDPFRSASGKVTPKASPKAEKPKSA